MKKKHETLDKKKKNHPFLILEHTHLFQSHLIHLLKISKFMENLKLLEKSQKAKNLELKKDSKIQLKQKLKD